MWPSPRGACRCRRGMPSGHEGVAEVVAVGDAVGGVKVGDRVIVPFQINCGMCAACRRGATGSCTSLAIDGDVRHGATGGARWRRLHGGPVAGAVCGDAMLVPLPGEVDPVAIASLSDNIPDGWRTVGPYRAELAALDPADHRVLVAGRLSIGLYAAAFAAAYGAHRRLRRHRPAAVGHGRKTRSHSA